MTHIINLPRTALSVRGGVIYIRHLKTGMEVEASPAALDTWCVARLRSSISAAPAVIDAPRRRVSDKAKVRA